MFQEIVLEIEDFGPIEANLEISKINLVSGRNGSGKSVAAKLLYYISKGIKDADVIDGLIFNQNRPEFEDFSTSFQNVIFIDSLSIMDNPDDLPLYQRDLLNQLSQNSGIMDEKSAKYYEIIKNLICGEFKYDNTSKRFSFENGDESHDVKNVASGFKLFGLMQILLSRNLLNENSMIIIDDVESNIHPELQVRLAELLVLMVKDFEFILYLNSKSPHFIEALEVFSGKYNLVDDSKFYITKKADEKFRFYQIPREDLFIIYDDLAEPYDEINEVRAVNIYNGIY